MADSTIGKKIDAIYKLREKIRGFEEQIKILAKEKEELEYKLLEQMETEGLTKSTGKNASVTISDSVRPTVEDWDVFYTYIHKKKFYHLLERRPSVTGCRELFEKYGKIPGVVPFTKRTVTMRTLN